MGATHSRIHDPLVGELASPVASSGAAGRATDASRLRCVLLLLVLTSPLAAQVSEPPPLVDSAEVERGALAGFASGADSLAWERDRTSALQGNGLRVLVSLRERRVIVMQGPDTVRTAPAAVASGKTIRYAGKSWTFRTPRGRHSVLRKVQDPVWTPPDWMYAEAAMEHDLELGRLRADQPVRLGATQQLVVRNDQAGIVDEATGQFWPLPLDEHIVFNGTLYIPPIATENRKVPGELGAYALDLGDGYLIHGTPHQRSLGRAVTHGCIRLGDEDIAWLFEHVAVGTPVHIY